MPEHEDADELIPQKVLDAAIDLLRHSAGTQCMQIMGNSMLPLIRNGDRVIVEPGVDGLRRGQVIVFRRDTELVAHRLLSKRRTDDRTALLTKGDRAQNLDTPLTAKEIIGRVIMIQRGDMETSLNNLAWRFAGPIIATSMLIGSRFRTRLLYAGDVVWIRLGVRALANVNRITAVLFQVALAVTVRLCTRWRSIAGPPIPPGNAMNSGNQ